MNCFTNIHLIPIPSSKMQLFELIRYQLVVKENSWQSLKRKLKAATKKTKPYSFDLRLAKIKEVYRGWVNKTDRAMPVPFLRDIHVKLKALDEWLRNRLRYCIWTDGDTESGKSQNARERT